MENLETLTHNFKQTVHTRVTPGYTSIGRKCTPEGRNVISCKCWAQYFVDKTHFYHEHNLDLLQSLFPRNTKVGTNNSRFSIS